MKEEHPNDPLHGVKLADIVEFMVNEYGWEELGERIGVRNFTNNPSINSNLKFLRKTPWARTKIENFYLYTLRQKQKE